MQSTTNYSMNLVEGTDLVNIPVQLNPNFQTIDQEMFANKQASIGTATEVVTGTVHAIVRANVDADMFRFTATGAWTAGDTMTLDGSAVTVHLADGTAPATGAYIIGAEVVAVVNGTLVTLLTSAAQPAAGVTSFNSRTGAVVPTASDYDASMIDYDNTSSGLTSTDTQSAIDELSSNRLPFVNYSTPGTTHDLTPTNTTGTLATITADCWVYTNIIGKRAVDTYEIGRILVDGSIVHSVRNSNENNAIDMWVAVKAGSVISYQSDNIGSYRYIAIEYPFA